jgi:hypothetical protein
VARVAAHILAVLAGLLVAACGGGDASDSDAPAGASATYQPPVLTIPEEVQRMKDVLPSQSHLMASVGHHWTQLWLAAEKRDWALADHNFEEARNHINWMIAIHPTRADAQGNAVNLKAAFDSVDAGAFAAVKQAMVRKNNAQFVTAYRRSLEGCYSCHRISGRPYLRLKIPT